MNTRKGTPTCSWYRTSSFQMRMLPSSDAVAARVPSGLMAALIT